MIKNFNITTMQANHVINNQLDRCQIYTDIIIDKNITSQYINMDSRYNIHLNRKPYMPNHRST